MNETKLTIKVKRMIKKEYPNAWVYKTSDRFTGGIPDLLICLDGRLIAIELKYNKNTASKIQTVVIKKIRRAGGVAEVCWSVEEVKGILKNGKTN